MSYTEKQIYKIVITGGPCAGKTTGIELLRAALGEKGFGVLVIEETATELISGGIAPWTLITNYEYQFMQMRLQLFKEHIFEESAKQLKGFDRVIIILDRGIIDNSAYMTAEEFKKAAVELNTSAVELRDRYDAVFQLVTTAKGAEEFYSLGNNAARTETVERAAELDDALISAWTGHPHYRIIDNSGTFKDKVDELIRGVFSFIGYPEPIEDERKFLIEYPNIEMLDALPNCHGTEITQYYLEGEDGERFRVRRRGEDGAYVYFKTVKHSLGCERKRIEHESRITKSEYDEYIKSCNCNGCINKKRYCLTYEGRYFEVDVYPFWNDKAIMELELDGEDVNDDKIAFPDFIKIVREVTEEREYKNSALAARYGAVK